ncbi:DUF6185 family protein [Streptomyces cinnamoneus]|uniref:Uncharacterized protein n=1 Tax=Streptomyces cinnamoneus TaxID=53446 RepID=A0A918TP00_STRCJ|nr:DUF6185 family protein [Streptomyces cinnamoneus]GHC56844.1 hypothetical protein GCM10010507_36900 [Streptomyces cinnamoneus]
MIFRAWRWIAVVFATLGWWAVQPAPAQAVEAMNCGNLQPRKVHVDSKIRFIRQNPDFVEVHQVTNIKVPESQWELANDLTLSPDTHRYRNALHCLLHSDHTPHKAADVWHPEWRSSASQATKLEGMVTAPYESWNLINSRGEFEVGPWTVTVEPDKDWRLAFQSPHALRGASWEKIVVDPDGLKISDAPGASSTEKEIRVWSGQSLEHVDVVPPKNLALGLSSRFTWIGSLGILSWWACSSIVIAWPAWRFLRSDRKPNGSSETAASKVMARTVLKWAGLSVALGLTLLLALDPSAGTPRANSWRALIGISSGFTLVLLAQPWISWNQGSGGNHKSLKVRKVMVTTCAGTAAAIGLLVILAPHLFGLPQNLTSTAPPPASGITGLALLDVSALWLWLTAMAAWAWRFAREGRLGEAPAEPARHDSLNRDDPRHSLSRIAAIGAALLVAAAMVVFFRAQSFERLWDRTNWMGEATTVLGADHRSLLGLQLADFAARGPQWVYAYTWVLTGIALVALLHNVSHVLPETPLEPKGVRLFAVTGIFAIVVALRGVKFAGSSAAVYGLWLPMNMITLYAMVLIGRRRSVLNRVNRKTKTNCLVAELSKPSGHAKLMEDARLYRTLLHRLHLVDQGHEEGTTRRSLETQLQTLHHWRPAECHRDCLPDPVSVVDVALSWGPKHHWWDNALHAARRASMFGILPSMVTAWYENAYGAHHWAFTLSLPTGIPDTVGAFLAREISFAGAGLVLGALWRVLPGERGPMRAFSLFVAWLIPISLVAMFSLDISRMVLGLQVLNVVLMLMVLTLTSMWVDTDTFKQERHYRTKRLGLLTSVYQVHGLSGQIAFLLAQAGAAVTIWHQIVTASK